MLVSRAVKLALAVGLVAWVTAGVSTAQAACDSPEHARLDFWIGEWDVSTESGAVVAQTSVQRTLEGCAVEQTWAASDGMRARGLFFYFERTGRWHLTWIETRGLLLRLDGRERDGTLVFSGDAPGRDGVTVHHEFSLERLEDGRLRQAWRQSRDGAADSAAAFALLYRRRER